MPFRVSYFFTQQSSRKTGGWSLNLWNNAADGSAVVDAAQSLRYRILSCLGNQTQCLAFRISDATSFRTVQLLSFAPVSFPGSDPSLNSDAFVSSALVRMEALGGYVSFVWFRGIWDVNVTAGGSWTPAPAWQTNWNAVAGLLTTGGQGWVLRKQNKTTPKQLILSVTGAGVISVPAHGFNTGDKGRVSRARGSLTGLNKIWAVEKLDTDTLQLIGWGAAQTGVYLGNGTIQKQTPTYIAISDVTIPRATKHNVGRPFDLLSGRRKARKT